MVIAIFTDWHWSTWCFSLSWFSLARHLASDSPPYRAGPIRLTKTAKKENDTAVLCVAVVRPMIRKYAQVLALLAECRDYPRQVLAAALERALAGSHMADQTLIIAAWLTDPEATTDDCPGAPARDRCARASRAPVASH